MRYYAEVRDRKYYYLNRMAQYPYNTFANDFLYFVSVTYGHLWVPHMFFRDIDEYEEVERLPRSYSPHHASPFTTTMRKAMGLVLVRHENHYREQYELLAGGRVEDRLMMFLEHFWIVFDDMVKEKRSPCAVFITLAYIARIAHLFYENGIRDALYLAPSLISTFIMCSLDALPGKAIHLLNTAALSIIDCAADGLF